MHKAFFIQSAKQTQNINMNMRCVICKSVISVIYITLCVVYVSYNALSTIHTVSKNNKERILLVQIILLHLN